MSRKEEILEAIANGEKIEMEANCRKEEYLLAIANGDGTENLPEPNCRTEELLLAIAAGGAGGDIETEDITITPTTSSQTVTRSSGKYINKVTVPAVTNAIDSNIAAENIKKDVTILGVKGTVEPAAPAGSEEWQPNPTWWDIKTILENDTRDYAYKAIYLFTDSTVSESSKNLNGSAYATSDGAFYKTVTLTHTWDRTKDKPCYVDGVEVYKTRYVIVYSNSIIGMASSQHNCLAVYGLSRVSLMSMFYYSRSLQTISELDTSNATELSQMFSECWSLRSIPELDTGNVTNLNSMFYNCYALKSIPALNTSNVTNMKSMFNSCYALKSIPELDTGNVTNMNSMFYNCYALQSIPELDTGNVTDMYSMFNSCYALQSIPELDTGNVTNMYGLFTNCYALQSIPALNTSNVTNMNGMFNGCFSLQSIPALNTSNVTNMNSMFSKCYALQLIPELDMENVTTFSSMFNNCSSLINMKLKNIKTTGLQMSSGTKWGHLLSVDSLVNTIKELWDYSGSGSSYTLTMGSENTKKLTSVYVKLITPTAEQIAEDANIESKMPCVECASTDEGAMLITDYALSKGWTIS